MQRRERFYQTARILVIGIGSGGDTAVSHILGEGVDGIHLITIDTDARCLDNSNVPRRVQIGEKVAGGRGANGDVSLGRQAAIESRDRLRKELFTADMVFVAAGMGGGTGTGAAPIVAGLAREQGALVVAIVTSPFSFEGEARQRRAEAGVAALKDEADTLIVIPNDRLLALAGGAVSFHETFHLADRFWYQSVQGISRLVNKAGLINVDFADIRSVMSEGGSTVIATGRGRGPDRARRAAKQATFSELLGVTIDGARGILFNVTGDPTMSLHEVEQAAAVVKERVHVEANLIFGAAIDESLRDEIHIVVIATNCGYRIAGANDRPGLRQDEQTGGTGATFTPTSTLSAARAIEGLT